MYSPKIWLSLNAQNVKHMSSKEIFKFHMENVHHQNIQVFHEEFVANILLNIHV